MNPYPGKIRVSSEETSLRHESRERDFERLIDNDRAFPRRRARPPLDLVIDYKDVETLRSFLMDSGRIVPARITRLNRKEQQELTRAVKRARQLALLPLSPRHGF